MSARNSSRSRAVGTRMKTRQPTSTAPGRFTAALLLAQDDDHDDGVPGALEHLLGLEAEEPLDELEAAGQLDQGLELLREDHAGQMRLAVEPAGAGLSPLARPAPPQNPAPQRGRRQGRE